MHQASRASSTSLGMHACKIMKIGLSGHPTNFLGILPTFSLALLDRKLLYFSLGGFLWSCSCFLRRWRVFDLPPPLNLLKLIKVSAYVAIGILGSIARSLLKFSRQNSVFEVQILSSLWYTLSVIVWISQAGFEPAASRQWRALFHWAIETFNKRKGTWFVDKHI